MHILAFDPDIEVRELYKKYLRRDEIETMAFVTFTFDASHYDVVIVSDAKAKHNIENIPENRIIVASEKVSAIKDGSWGLTKPFHMQELLEILEVIRTGQPVVDDPSQAQQ